MNINFGESYYSGDPFWVSILLSFTGAFIGFGFALILYYKTTSDAKKKEADKAHSEAADSLFHFYTLLDGSVSHIEDLLKNLADFVINQRKDLLQIQIIKYRVNNDIQRLDKNDSHSIFIAYRHFMSIEKDWKSDFQRIYISIDAIKETEIEVKRVFKYHTDDSYRRELGIKDIIDSIPATLASYSREISDRLGNDRVNNGDFQFLDGAIGKYSEVAKNGSNLTETEAIYLIPLINELLKNHNGKPYTTELLMMIRSARTKMDDLRRDIDSFTKEIESIPNGLQTHIDSVKNKSREIQDKIKASID